VVGDTKKQHRLENKRKRIDLQTQQEPTSYWSKFAGQQVMPTNIPNLKEWKGQMCPRNLALHHPAAAELLKYATGGCPVKSGKPWTRAEIEAAIARGNHSSAQEPEAIEFHMAQVQEKIANKQCRIVLWDDIKDNIPPQLKVSPLAMVPHKSRAFRAILDLSFGLRLDDGGEIMSVNESTEKTAPYGAIDQLGHSLSRIIHALAEVDDNAKVFFAKFDIKDGFWRLDAADGEEWNFCYVLPQPDGEPTRLVVPTSLQMGWVESPAYFCAASETGRDVASCYAEMELGSLPPHKFTELTQTHDDFKALPHATDGNFSYFFEAYVDDYMSLAIATSQQQLNHISSALMHGIHDVFPPHEDPDQDSLSVKKIRKGEGAWALRGDLLGFTANGDIGPKSIWLEEPKRDKLLVILHQWIRAGRNGHSGVEYSEFRSVIAKIRHAFVAIPNGLGLLSPCNDVLRREPRFVYFHRNKVLLEALVDIRTLLKESICKPTLCKELVNGWPGYVAIVDASGHGVGIVVVGESLPCAPTVCRVEWPEAIKKNIVSDSNPDGKITNSDLESAGALLAWLVVECTCDITPGTHVAIYSDNDATVVRIRKRKSKARIAGALIRALSLRLKYAQASPLTPLHIQGKRNMITDVPSRSFGSEPAWHWKTHEEFYTNFNAMFPLPSQHSWNVFVLNFDVFMRVVCVLQMQDLSLDEWRRLPKIGRYIGPTGPALFGLWEWTHTWRIPLSKSGAESSQPLQDSSELDFLVTEGKSKLQQSLRTSLPLARRSVWPATLTPQK
jgi:PAS domain-containing protein